MTSPAAVAAPTSAIEVPAQSNIEAVREAQEQYRQTATPEEYAAAMRAYEELRTTGAITTNQMPGGTDVTAQGFGCVSIPKWAVVAYAWRLKAGGVVGALTGAVVSGTILGLPAGVVIEAIGAAGILGGDGLLYWADHTDWPKNICI
ncbi:hypothetical protein J5O04_01420 [Corynebacterium hindlerae]|uniref:hypothetical protein n=1 Tax=Corynebacterium hindlerae TaxID=699041 RepID=UPI001AD7D482|nr:hypothetical protein [Corynebacterium hindlerae]QTH59830.1 hypothetical protein J5O04_01420 [Corynebacterium hindlerae]